MKFIALFILSVLIVGLANAQKKTRPYKCGYITKDRAALLLNNKNYLRFYGCKEGEKIASVGASNGYVEVQIAIFVGKIDWTIQDIDTTCLNQRELEKVIDYHEKLMSEPIIGNFEIVVGEPHKTNLKKNFYDRILLSNVYHELTDRKSILIDIIEALSQDGVVVIMERMAKKIGQKRKDCGHVMLWEPDLLAEMKGFGFSYVTKEENSFGNTFYTFGKQ
jgi:hypothetical protein